MTSEGDRVSLSSSSEVNTSFSGYTFQGFTKEQGIHYQHQQFSTSTQKNVNLLVDGDLNEQELADIHEFLQSAKNILQELGQGHTEEAAHAAVSLENLESLSQAALFIRQATSVSLSTQSTRVALQEGTGFNEYSRKRAQVNPPEQENPLEYILNKLRETQERIQLDPEQLATRLPTLVTTLIKSLENHPDSTDSPPTILEQIRKTFVESLLKSTKNVKDPLSTDQTQPTSLESSLNTEAKTPGTSLEQATTHKPYSLRG